MNNIFLEVPKEYKPRKSVLLNMDIENDVEKSLGRKITLTECEDITESYEDYIDTTLQDIIDHHYQDFLDWRLVKYRDSENK